MAEAPQRRPDSCVALGSDHGCRDGLTRDYRDTSTRQDQPERSRTSRVVGITMLISIESLALVAMIGGVLSITARQPVFAIVALAAACLAIVLAWAWAAGLSRTTGRKPRWARNPRTHRAREAAARRSGEPVMHPDSQEGQ